MRIPLLFLFIRKLYSGIFWLSALFSKIKLKSSFLGHIFHKIYQEKNGLPKGFFVIFVL